MLRYSGVVLFLDGRREPFATGLAGARAWELYAIRHELPLNPTPETLERFPVQTWRLVIAHAALKVEAGLETWAAEVDDVELNAENVDPFPAAPSSERRSSSPSASVGVSER